MKIEGYPHIDCETGEVRIIYPKVKKSKNGEIMSITGCWVKGNELDCYDWEDEDYLIVLGALPKDEEKYLPVELYYVFNSCDLSYGWVTEDQVIFEIGSLSTKDLAYGLPRVDFSKLEEYIVEGEKYVN